MFDYQRVHGGVTNKDESSCDLMGLHGIVPEEIETSPVKLRSDLTNGKIDFSRKIYNVAEKIQMDTMQWGYPNGLMRI